MKLIRWLMIVLVACVSAGSACTAAPVVLQLRFDHQFEFAGYYVALWDGLYADAGLDVEIRSAFGPDGRRVSASEAVASGDAHFGIGAADVLVARDQGADLVILASIFPRSAALFYTAGRTPMLDVAGLRGRRVARVENDLTDVEFQAMLRAAGISVDDVVTLPHDYATSLSDLLSGRVDLIPSYRISPYKYRDLVGHRIHPLRPEDHGVDFYGDSLFADGELVATRPDLVDRFVAASLEGWRRALNDSTTVANRIVDELPVAIRHQDQLLHNLLQAQAIRTMLAADTVGIGTVVRERWQRMQRELAAAGVVRSAVLPERAFYDAAARVARLERRAAGSRTLISVLAGATLLLVCVLTWSVRRGPRRIAATLEHVLGAVAAGSGAAVVWRQTPGEVVVTAGIGKTLVAGGGNMPLRLDAFLAEVAEPDREPVRDAFVGSAENDELREVEWRGRANQRWFLLRLCHTAGGADGVIFDITGRKAVETEFRRLALRDELTGLANRRGLRHWAQAVTTTRQAGETEPWPVGVALLDVDDFKAINDAHGHAVGDMVLRRIGQALQEARCSTGLAARLGGDEFVAILPGVTEPDARAWATSVERRLAEPMSAGRHRIGIGVSIGLAMGDLRVDTLDRLLVDADAALYARKRLADDADNLPAARIA